MIYHKIDFFELKHDENYIHAKLVIEPKYPYWLDVAPIIVDNIRV